jgi:hypothetical protein
MPCLAILARTGRPVHACRRGDLDRDAAFLLEEVDGVLREEAAIPLGALVGGVGAALGREVGGGLVGVVGDGFHELVVELDGFSEAKGRPLR